MTGVLSIITFVLSCFFIHDLVASPKWKGSWFLRGTSMCKEVVLDRKGVSVLGNRPCVIVEKKGNDFYLTTTVYEGNYSYQMDELHGVGYNLTLVSVGPNQRMKTKESDSIFTGIYRKLIDCQAYSDSLKEVNIK